MNLVRPLEPSASVHERFTASRRQILAGAGAAGISIAAGTGGLRQASAQESGTLIIGFNLDPETMNPMLTTNAASESVISAAVEKLALFEAETMAPTPWLAESWEYEDPQRFVIHLKEGVAFSNGEPFNASSAKFSIDMWASQPVMAQAAAVLEGMDVEVVDDTTIAINTPTPVPTLPALMSRYWYMLPPEYYQETGDEGFGQAPIGTGPFVLEAHDAAQQVVFVRNPDWWNGTHPIERVVFRVMPEELSRAVALEAGEIDIAYYLSASTASRLESAEGAVVHTTPGLRKFLSAFNAEMPGGEPLLDPAVRVALNQAIDLDGIVEFVFEGEATKLEGQYALPEEFGYNDQISDYGYDPDAARQAIADAGYPDGFPMTYAYTIGRYPKDKEVGEIVATYLQEVGIEVEQKPLEWGEFNQQRLDQTLGHAFQVGLLLIPDLSHTFDYMAYAKEARGGPMMTWSDAWWELFEQSKTEVDEGKRADLYHQMLQIDHDEPYGIYLFAPYDYYATSSRVQGFAPRKDQMLLLFDLSLEG